MMKNEEREDAMPISLSEIKVTETSETSSESLSFIIYRYGSFLIAFLLIAAAMYCRIRLLDVPLERDEGGFAYIGQQLLRGVSPYHSGNMKILPGIHFAYAGIMMLFGENAMGIHAGLLVINLISILLIYILARRMLSIEGAAVAVGSFAILTVSQSVLGLFAHATHFVILFVLLGLIAFLNGIKKCSKKYIFISGLCLGTSVLMKQHGAFFCLFAFCYLAGDALKQKKHLSTVLQWLLILTVGIIIPYAAAGFYMYVKGVFNEFWFWTFIWSIDYASGGFSALGLTTLLHYFQIMSLNVALLWVLSLFGLGSFLYLGKKLPLKWFFSLFILFSALATLPGFTFYQHYFILMLPSLSLLSGYAFESFPRITGPLIGLKNARIAVFTTFMAVTIFTYYNRFEYLFTLRPYYVSRTIYGANPFPESQEIAKYIKNNSAPGTPIAVIGSEPQIYFYADRPSATDYLYMYPLVEQQPFAIKMQEEMKQEIQNAAPEYIVYVWVSTSWQIRGEVAFGFLDWVKQYLEQHYQQVGLVDMVSFNGSNYFWDLDAKNRRPTSDFYVLVYRRISL